MLGAFSTNLPVYDGERLYLLVFPLWALLIGRGFAGLWEWCRRLSTGPAEATPHPDPPPQGGREPTNLRSPSPPSPQEDQSRVRGGPRKAGKKGWLISGLVLLLLAQSYGVLTQHPYNLSYYSGLVGGLPGAERLGLELAYWSESVDRRLLGQLVRQMTPDSTAALAPTLAPGQGGFATGRALVVRKAFLYDEDKAAGDDFLVVYRRTAYWKPEIQRIIREGQTIAENARHGVWLSRLIRRAKRGSPPVQRGGNS